MVKVVKSKEESIQRETKKINFLNKIMKNITSRRLLWKRVEY